MTVYWNFGFYWEINTVFTYMFLYVKTPNTDEWL